MTLVSEGNGNGKWEWELWICTLTDRYDICVQRAQQQASLWAASCVEAFSYCHYNLGYEFGYHKRVLLSIVKFETNETVW